MKELAPQRARHQFILVGHDISLGDLAKRHGIEPVVGDTMRGIRIAHITRLKNQLSIH
ncbi:hypothetical protein [Chromohalobacter nigrandesensis]|uniref:hypothetical protein n=1 Tax=Chromohalobacter nigrandesensis TaxID=119863 RepID=UPI001FF68DC7|nr:hypothetical protein [Chromohalobacter nigrandesensis]MCK0745451.1 hypothetical protein [Chromohalobacter nigrandesensis]